MRYFLLLLLSISFSITAGAQDFSTPESTFEVFREAAGSGDVELYIRCTTKESQRMLRKRTPSVGQMSNEYTDIAGRHLRVHFRGDEAVIYLLPEDAHNPPYFAKKEKGLWKIDLKYMSENIYFDHNNEWHWRK